MTRFERRTANGLRLDKDQALGFRLAGSDRNFHVADARIVDETRLNCSAPECRIRSPYAEPRSNPPLGSLLNGK